MTWDLVTQQLTNLGASFVTDETGPTQTVVMQSDTFTRDILGRVTQIASAVPNAGSGPGAGEVTGQCFTYDGFNRLAAAWSVADASAVQPCDTAAPASDTEPGWDASAEAYSTQWSYSPSGMITQIVNGALAPSSATLTYGGTNGPVHAVTAMSDGVTSNAFEYDAAGRQVSRTVDTVETTLVWDVSSNLVESAGAGGHVVYAYDASGQRVAKIQVADATHTGAVTAYLGSTEVTDADTSTNADLGANPTALGGTAYVTATRFYTFAGATVAVREATPTGSTMSLMFGDEQGSAQVMMPVQLDAVTGAMQPATLADAAAATRNAYAPYGAVRGADHLSIEHGWLNQIADTGTGLTYLNARYYDPLLSRFISPDPLMNPTDPRTLDPYRYADNNPVMFKDNSGLAPSCSGLTGSAYDACSGYASKTYNYSTGESAQAHNSTTNSIQAATGAAQNASTASEGVVGSLKQRQKWVDGRVIKREGKPAWKPIPTYKNGNWARSFDRFMRTALGGKTAAIALEATSKFKAVESVGPLFQGIGFAASLAEGIWVVYEDRPVRERLQYSVERTALGFLGGELGGTVLTAIATPQAARCGHPVLIAGCEAAIVVASDLVGGVVGDYAATSLYDRWRKSEIEHRPIRKLGRAG